MNPDLFLAILSMDSYNRGYRAGVAVTGNIGHAGILKDSSVLLNSGQRADIPAGFYAIAYEWNGQTVIAYRGTDDYTSLNAANDFWSGWTVGAGFSSASQAELAKRFYTSVTGQSVYDAATGVTLTGHSLGGGLAGFVSSLSGAQAVGFDHMPFGVSAISDAVQEAARRNGGDAPATFADVSMNAPATSLLRGYHIDGEALESIRSGALQLTLSGAVSNLPLVGGLLASIGQSLSSTTAQLEQGVFKVPLDLYEANLPHIFPATIEAVARHSQALLVTMMFGQEWEAAPANGTAWREAVMRAPARPPPTTR